MEEYDVLYKNIIRNKNKRGRGRGEGSKNQNDIILEVVPVSGMQKKCKENTAICATLEKSPPYSSISIDVWFHIYQHIAPEDVQTFALICRDTANIVNSKIFWKQLYRKYCQKSQNKHWVLQLPEQLQPENIRKCDSKSLPYKIIKSLFYCHAPLLNRLNRGYSVDMLLGRSYIASWHYQSQGIYVMCYKFWNRMPHNNHSQTYALPALAEIAVDDWELLADESGDILNNNEISCATKFVNPHEGVCILLIYCDKFVPFPVHLLYDRKGSNREHSYRLSATRQKLGIDRRTWSFELDLTDPISKFTTTVKYPKLIKHFVIPWWHSKFEFYLKIQNTK